MHLQFISRIIGLIILTATVISPLISLFLPPLKTLQVLAQTSNTSKFEADRLLKQGNELLDKEFETAIASLQKALRIYRELQEKQEEGQVLKSLGDAFGSRKDYRKAIEYYQQGLKIVSKLDDRILGLDMRNGLGRAYINLNEYDKAIPIYQKVLAITHERNSSLKGMAALMMMSREIEPLLMIGVAYSSLGNYDKAVEYSQQGLQLAQKFELPMIRRPVEAIFLPVLGLSYSALGDYNKAIEYSQKSLATAQERQKNVKGVEKELWQLIRGLSLIVLGIAYPYVGDYEKALDYSQQALEMAQESKDLSTEGIAMYAVGAAYFFLEDYTKAHKYAQQSLEIVRRTRNRSLEMQTQMIIGGAYYGWGNYDKAVESLRQSWAIAAQDPQSLPQKGLALNYLGFALLKAGQLKQAEDTLRSGIQVWESVRELSNNDASKVAIFESQAETYRTLQKVLIAQNKIEAALEIAERGRARAFVGLLASRYGILPANQPTVSPLKLQKIQQVSRERNATLVEYSIIYDDSKVKPKLTKESKLFIWVVQPTGKVDFRQVDLNTISQTTLKTPGTQAPQSSGRSLSDLVSQTRSDLEAKQGQPQSNSGLGINPLADGRLRQLHQLLIEPIADLLPTDPNARVIFMPQQSLFFVPFLALQDASGKRLIEKHTILTAPAIQVLQLTRQQREKLRQSPAEQAVVVGIPRNALVVGNPIPMPGNLQPLVGAEDEAKAIASLLKTQPLLGNQATKANVLPLLSQARIIHLATHGLLDDPQGTGIPGAIALAPSGRDNGFLTAAEILNLKLKAELAVLSACDTGKGRLTEDGVIGLSRSLISAGVPSVIVSLWKVKDDSTALLMTEFYRNLTKNPDKAQALRQAMLTTMAKYPDPVYWAAFTLIGEAE
jgi:CHAT domain-containing protein